MLKCCCCSHHADTGRFGVARIAYDWVDRSRQDTFSSDSGSHREIMVYVWYPAQE
jgi:hypothetical protein